MRENQLTRTRDVLWLDSTLTDSVLEYGKWPNHSVERFDEQYERKVGKFRDSEISACENRKLFLLFRRAYLDLQMDVANHAGRPFPIFDTLQQYKCNINVKKLA